MHDSSVGGGRKLWRESSSDYLSFYLPLRFMEVMILEHVRIEWKVIIDIHYGALVWQNNWVGKFPSLADQPKRRLNAAKLMLIYGCIVFSESDSFCSCRLEAFSSFIKNQFSPRIWQSHSLSAAWGNLCLPPATRGLVFFSLRSNSFLCSYTSNKFNNHELPSSIFLSLVK